MDRDGGVRNDSCGDCALSRAPKWENIRRQVRLAVQFGRAYPMTRAEAPRTTPDPEPHRYSSRCHIVLKCKECERKWLAEDLDTLPDAAREASLANMEFLAARKCECDGGPIREECCGCTASKLAP